MLIYFPNVYNIYIYIAIAVCFLYLAIYPVDIPFTMIFPLYIPKLPKCCWLYEHFPMLVYPQKYSQSQVTRRHSPAHLEASWPQ